MRRVLLDADVLTDFFSKKRAALKDDKKRGVELLSELNCQFKEGKVEFLVTWPVALEFLPGVWSELQEDAQSFIDGCTKILPTESQFSDCLLMLKDMYQHRCRHGSVVDLMNSYYSVYLNCGLLAVDRCYRDSHAKYFHGKGIKFDLLLK